MRLTWIEITVFLTTLAMGTRAFAQDGGDAPTVAPVTVGALLEEFADPFASLMPAVPAWTLESMGGKAAVPLSKPVLGGGGQLELFRADGPGALVRLAVPRAEGRLRFFIDGNPIPAVDGDAKDVVAGGLTLFAPPFSMKSAEGGVLLFPIPFAKSLLVTTDSAKLSWSASWRRYPPKTRVRPFEMKDAVIQSFGAAEALGGLRASLGDVPLTQPAQDASVRLRRAPIQVSVKPGETVLVLERKAEAPALVTRFVFDETLPFLGVGEAKSLELRILIDGKTAVDMPLLDFFGRTDAAHLCATRRIRAVTRLGGALLRRSIDFPIPFEKTFILQLANVGTTTVEDLRFSIHVDKGEKRFHDVMFRATRGPLPGASRVAAALVLRGSSPIPGPRGPFQWAWRERELDVFPLGVAAETASLITWGYSRRSR